MRTTRSYNFFKYLTLNLPVHQRVQLRNNSRMPGSMLILTWVGIIFVIILHRAIARFKILKKIMPIHVKISIEPGIRELFRFQQGIYGNFMHSSVPRQGLFFGRCSNYLPLLFTRIYNATEAVPITTRYYLQEYM